MNFNSITELQDFIIEKSMPFESFDTVLLYIYYKLVESNCHIHYFYLPASKKNNKIEDETKFKEYIKLKVTGIPLNNIWKIEIKKETNVDGKYNLDKNEYIVDNTFNAKDEQDKCRNEYKKEKERLAKEEEIEDPFKNLKKGFPNEKQERENFTWEEKIYLRDHPLTREEQNYILRNKPTKEQEVFLTRQLMLNKAKRHGSPGLSHYGFGKYNTLQRLNNEIKYLIALKK